MFTIELLTRTERCEYQELILRDNAATPDDLMLIPDAFLEAQPECGEIAVVRITISDHWNEAMNAEPDTYCYCQTHADQLIDNCTEPE